MPENLYSGATISLFGRIYEGLVLGTNPPPTTAASGLNLASQLDEGQWEEATESEVRAKLLEIDDETLESILDQRETCVRILGVLEREP